MFDPISLTVAAGLAGLSAASASSQNRALGTTQRNATASADAQAKALADGRAVDQLRKRQQIDQLRSKIAATAAENGVGFGGNTAMLDAAAAASGAIDASTIDTNYQNNIDAVRLGLQSQINQLQSQKRSPGAAFLTGGLQGYSTGLGILQATQVLSKPIPETKAPVVDNRTGGRL